MEKMAASGLPEHHHHLHHQHSAQSQEVIANSGSVSSNTSSSQTPLIGLPLAPPRTPPDQASLQSSMDKNKETLKRKLMLRRSVNELVDRGIYPPLKTPPAFAEKTKQLERAKTGDLLRHKIQQRPDRQLLVQQHILEDTTIDPSLHERQRLLKRSRLLDGLNGKLAHRPGPLELVQGNILQPSHELANAIKDGTIQFLPTCDTEDMEHSSSSFLFDDESTGSDGAPSPSMDESSDVSSPNSTTPVSSSESLPISFTLSKSISVPLAISKSSQIPFVSANSAIITASSSTSTLNSNLPGTSFGASIFSCSNNSSLSNSSGKSRSKKPKPKTMSKARIIKFHEYKGPPSVVKNQSSNVSAAAAVALGNGCVEDTPYHILLQQQQLFLQWQLEFQQKQQHGTTTVSAGSDSATSPTLNSVIVTSPVVTSAPATQIQPIVAGGSGLVQAVSLQQPQTPNSTVVAPGAFSLVSIPSSSQASTQQASPAPPPPPPPPPLPPVTRPTQSVAPRQSAKALTAIPASALSLPKLTANLEEMKVADLKAELKKRSLPVSGPKPQLIERLKPFTESSSSNSPLPSTVVPKTPNSRPPSCTSAPLQFSQTTFHIKTEPNGETTASPVTRPIPTSSSLLTSSSASGASSHTSSAFSMPITLPFSVQGIKTVVSVKPMVKEEPVTMTDISPANSPPTLQASTPIPTTPMTPEYEASSPPSLTPKLTLPSHPIVQSLGKSAKITNNQFIHNGSPGKHSGAHGQTVVSMNADLAHSASVVPAEMMPMEVDSVSIDLNQGVDDTAFKAASLGHSLDSANFKALVQHSSSTAGFKTVSLSPNCLDSHSLKTVSINTNLMDANTVKTINLSPNYDAGATIKTINISPNTDPATIKAINLGSSAEGVAVKTLSLSPGADGLKTISLSPVKDGTSLLKTIKVPLSQVSPTHLSPVQLTGPLAHTLSSPTSLLQLQQLQTLQQLQQQLLQQTQLSQHQFHQQTLQQPSQTASVQLTANDHVVLAQAKQIEELQRQLQESHLKLKLQQLQQQHLQLQQQQQQHQQQQQQQQQQLWQVQLPANFTQNSLLTKLSQDQLTLTPQNGHVVTPLQLQQQQQQQSTQVMLQPTASVVQQQPTSLFLNAHTNQQAAQVVSGVQQAHIRPQQQQQQQQQTPVMITNQNIVSNGTSISAADVSIANAVTSDSGFVNMTGLTSGQMTSATTGQATVSLPYAIHINLTSSGQVKLPPVTTSAAAAAATTTKSSTLAPLQLPAQLLLTSTSNSILTTQQIKSEPCTPRAMGPPSTTSVPKSQVTSGHSYVFTATPSSTLLIPGHTNGVISRTMSLPSASVISEQQKLNVQCSSPNAYFSGPLKEPPRYDEAIKIKQQQNIPPVNPAGGNSKALTSSDGCLNKPLTLGRIDTGVKSQTMDDVLEILIRNGDLPPSAANEALPAGKLTQVIELPATSSNIVISTSAPCLSVAPSVSASLVTAQCQPVPSSSSPAVPTVTSTVRSMNNNVHQNHQHYQFSNSSASPRDHTLASVHTNMYSDTLMNDTQSSPPNHHDTSGSSSLMLNDGTSHSDEGELLDWGEMLPSPDLCNMDWSSESGFGHLDLGDSSLHLDSKSGDSHNSSGVQSSCDTRYGSNLAQDPMCTSSEPGSYCYSDSTSYNKSSGFCTLTVHGSEPDLAAFNLGGDTSEAIDPASQMDMSEWLDVIMPNPTIHLECMNTPTSVTYTSDPILTPRTQQDVFDIFNFDDSDFGSSVMSWDKVMEQGTSS